MRCSEEAYVLWSSGQALNAGAVVYAQVPRERRPLWAVGILEQCLPLIPSVAEFEQVRALAYVSSRWKEAHEAFSAVRQLTLKSENSDSTDSLYALLLFLAENTAKVIFNASGEPAPFDEDVGHWVVRCARDVMDKANTPGLEESVWSAIVSTG